MSKPSRDRFCRHELTPENVARIERFRVSMKGLADEVDFELVMPGREKALVLTHLENAMMWFSRAVCETCPGNTLIP